MARTAALLALTLVACGSSTSSDGEGGAGSGAGGSSAGGAGAGGNGGGGTAGTSGAPSAAFAPWTSYGRDDANTRTNPDENTIGADNVANLERKWMWEGAAVTGTPTIANDTLYFGNWASNVVALDPATGAEQWTADLQPASGINQINHTPVVTADTIYAGAHAAELFAVDRATGNRVWADPLALDDQVALMLWSSPAVVDDLLVIGVGSYQVFIPSMPKFRGNIVGVDLTTREVRWRTYVTDVSGVSVWSSPAIDRDRGMLFVGTGQPYDRTPESPMSDALVALRYETGEIVWSYQFTADDVFQLGENNERGPDHDVGASPNLFELDGRPVVGVGDKGGSYAVLDRDTGDEIWRQTLTVGGANGGVMASTAYDAGVIYVASNDGTSGGTAGMGRGPSAGTVFALDATDGSSRWERSMPSSTFGALTYANGVLYVPTVDGVLYAIDARTGNELWSDQIAETMASGITVSGGMVFAGFGWNWIPAGVEPGGVVAYGLPD